MKNRRPRPSAKHTVRDPYLLLQLLSEFTEIPIIDICSKNRRREIVQARKFFYSVLYAHNTMSLEKIGEFLATMPGATVGAQDHSTIINAHRTNSDLIEVDAKYAQEWAKFLHYVRSDEKANEELNAEARRLVSQIRACKLKLLSLGYYDGRSTENH